MTISDRALDLMEYFKIRKDSNEIKRVEELAIKRDVAESVGKQSEIQNIDAELSTIGEQNA
jgi:hypothetical protein